MDAIAESVVDFVLDNNTEGKARIAVDGIVKNNLVILAGEITASEYPDFAHIASETIKEIGYTEEKSPTFNNANVITNDIFTRQSAHIAQGVDHDNKLESAGDIGIMFGGAVKEAPDYTGWAHFLARLLSYEIYNYGFEWARPDQKTQVTIKYEDGVHVGISDIVVCISHDENKPLAEIKDEIAHFVKAVLSQVQFPEGFELDYNLHVNPTGAFAIYGPVADSGEVGRKIVCDQYGGYFPVGGGNLNGKDATKVDRSAVYMARFVAKQVVAKGYADKCCIQLSYAIGQLEPISINVECYGTEKVERAIIDEFVNSFSYIPGRIIERFKLDKTTKERGFEYKQLGMYGHIGDLSMICDEVVQLPWEEI